LGSYGIGKQRTLEQYFEFSGVNVPKNEIDIDCVRYWIEWDDTQIKNEIMQMDKPSKPTNKIKIVDDKNEKRNEIISEQLDESSTTTSSLFWFVLLFGIAGGIVTGGCVYEQNIKSACQDFGLQFKSEAHMV